jgi:hypothetical protein
VIQGVCQQCYWTCTGRDRVHTCAAPCTWEHVAFDTAQSAPVCCDQMHGARLLLLVGHASVANLTPCDNVWQCQMVLPDLSTLCATYDRECTSDRRHAIAAGPCSRI